MLKQECLDERLTATIDMHCYGYNIDRGGSKGDRSVDSFKSNLPF